MSVWTYIILTEKSILANLLSMMAVGISDIILMTLITRLDNILRSIIENEAFHRCKC